MNKKQIRREIRRLQQMAAMGGSSAALAFEAQIVALRRAHNFWGVV